MSETVFCCQRLYGQAWHNALCSRKMVVERNGKPYCKQHDPEAVAAKRTKWEQKAQAKQDASTARYESAKRLAAKLGYGRPDYDGVRAREYTGGIVLTAEEAQRLIEQRKEGGAP